MLASQGFPVYGHSPPAGFLMEYAPAMQPCRVYGGGGGVRRALPSRHSAPVLPYRPYKTSTQQAPRPCLRPPADAPAPQKKRVVFADDRGFALAQVRVMWEPSDVPPHWSVRSSPPPALAAALRGQQPAPGTPFWELGFAQPASDYVDFRRRINEENVSLENVIIRAKEGFLTGTVKVKNIDFEKEVVVRWSADGWATSEDAFCTFVDAPISSSAGPITVYDTFSFKILLPVVSNRLDFCVCFRCRGTEFWDNNGGANYTVTKRGELPRSESPPPPSATASATKANGDAYAQPPLWSEYASWHGPCDVPYW